MTKKIKNFVCVKILSSLFNMSDRHGSRPIDSVGGRSFVRSSATPQATRPIEITTAKNSSAKFVIEKPQRMNISIGKTQNQSTPKIERNHTPLKVQAPARSQNQAPASNPVLAPPPDKVMVQAPAPIITTPRSSAPHPPPQASHSAPVNQPAPVAQTQSPPIVTNEFISPKPPAPADYFSKFSFLSFVQSFKEERSFNETDLNALGLNLNKEEPLLPMLHSVLSDAPLLNNSCYPMPKSYTAFAKTEDPTESIQMFSAPILLFIFYTQMHTEMQTAASNELMKRGFSYDEEKGSWSNPEGAEWDINQWKFAEPETDD